MKKILIIDDESDIRNLIKEILYINGYNDITDMPDALGALDCHNTNKFDLMILDYNLPGINGKEFVTTLREYDNKTKVIMITGNFLTEEIKELLFQKKIQDYIPKPFSVDKFACKINKFLCV